jgi:hypothetical protein
VDQSEPREFDPVTERISLAMRYQDPATNLLILEDVLNYRIIVQFPQVGSNFRSISLSYNEWASLGSAMLMLGRPHD